MSSNNGGHAAIQVVRSHGDARGILFEPLDARELSGQRNVHVVLTVPGETRGNHFHRSTTEVSVVVGPCLVRLREDGRIRDVEVPAGEAWRFTIPPGVVHAYRNTGSAAMVLVSFASAEHDPANPDTVRESIL